MPKWDLVAHNTVMKVTFFKSVSEFRTWLKENHSNHTELWVGFRKKASGKPSVSYPEAVEEALCFGWIDGLKKRVDADSYTHRFTPRRPKSQWSAVNIARARKLIAGRRMSRAGLMAFEGVEDTSRTYSYEQRNAAELSAVEKRQFHGHTAAWEFFQSQAPWYRRTATWWVISAKREETRRRRLNQLIADSAAARTILPLTRKPESAKVPGSGRRK